MRATLIVFLLSLITNLCFPQAGANINDIHNVYDEKGDFYFDRKEYNKAIVYYNMAYKKDANNYYSVLKKAEAYTALDLNAQAIECYRIIFATNLRIPNEYRLEYAMLLLKNKDIKGYEEWLGKYNEVVNNEISGFVTSSDVRSKMYYDSLLILVENESILNTSESEIAPVVYKDKLLFASTRKSLSGSSANNYYNIYQAEYIKNANLGRINKFNNSLDTEENESAITVEANSNKMYVTRQASTTSVPRTFVSNMPAARKDILQMMEFTVEGISSIGQPTFNSKGTKVYFAAISAEGSGGYDIYSSEFTGGKWTNVRNLGNLINTNKDEMYPFILNDTLLFFTSDGHIGSGGLDLYSVSLKKENSVPKNLGPQINSKFDDYGLSFSPDGYTGYFCSNRSGGFGQEDIYRLHMVNLKIKYAAYKFKKSSTIEPGKINLYLSDGTDYNIASQDKSGFDFGFTPQEDYLMIIQHENPLANDIISNDKLSESQRQKEFLDPKPIEKTEIKLEAGQRYDFTAGVRPIGADYKQALKNMADEYTNSSSSAIDLTALAKELLIFEGEVYTIQFIKDNNVSGDGKSKEATSLFINNELIDVAGRSFFFVLPLDIQTNFNIKTNIEHFKETFSPKKVGAVAVDTKPVYQEAPKAEETKGFPILVNTESFAEAGKAIEANELTIVPGSMYILTLNTTNEGAKMGDEIFIPLTKGVKYNLGSEVQSITEYNKLLNELKSNKPAEDDRIDVSVLSKELDIISGENIVFNLMPALKIGTQSASKSVLTTLDVDGRKFYVTDKQKLQVNLKLDQNKKVNIQTDIDYLKENFDPSTIQANIDTTSFRTNLTENDVITDPVFDIIVVNFNLNEYSIRTDAKDILDNKVVSVLKADERLYVTIKGYTDALGDADYNEKLSRDRAQAVKDYLTGKGVGESRIRTFSFGESLALEEGVNWEDLNEAELQKHRKVEIVIYLPKNED